MGYDQYGNLIEMDTSAIFSMYAAYLIITVAMTVWVQRTLSKNGIHFLIDVFGGDEVKATAVNHLLVVGFYLVNLGFVCSNMSEHHDHVRDQLAALEVLVGKLGFVLVALGGMHFFNLFVLSRMRKSSAQVHSARPPVAPNAWLSTSGVPTPASARMPEPQPAR